jgi:excisionase family DNA binding protein
MTSATGSLDGQNDRASSIEPLMSPGDVARFLGLPLRTIYRWRLRGEGPRGYRVGRHVRYRARDVERWLEHHRDAS